MSIYAVILFCLLSALSSPTTAEEIGSGKDIISMEDLKFTWYYEIIPLLQEYFYGDWVKIRES